MSLTFDTSGHFHVMPGHPLHVRWGDNILTWDKLDPFTQGYVEALMKALRNGDLGYLPRAALNNDLAFKNVAPETLARIMEDCARWEGALRKGMRANIGLTAQGGRDFFALRQRGMFNDFPSLTPYLGGDGKVYLREAA